MKIFALETEHEKLKNGILLAGEEEDMCVGYHWIKFVGSAMSHGFMTLAFAAIMYALWHFNAPMVFSPLPLALLFFAYFWFIGFPVITAFVDYLYDHIMVTSNRIVIIDQSSIFKRNIIKMDLQNIASVKAKTQWLNLFPFGTLVLDLKEGIGKSLTLKFIPNADKVASCISCNLRDYQTKMGSSPSTDV